MAEPRQQHPLVTLRPVFPRQLPDLGARVMHVYGQMRNFQRFPPQRQDALLTAQVNRLLQHAKRHAPFWSERLKGWTPRREPPARLLESVQPLTRRELQGEFDRLSASYPQREALGVAVASSSGSTGTPVKIERAVQLYMPVYYAITLLSARWHRIDQRKPVGVLGNKYKDKERATLGMPFKWLGPVATGFEYCTRGREAAEIYAHCAAKKAAYLQCGPSTLTALAQYAAQSGRNDLRFEKALTLGSAVTPEMRDTVRRAFGAEIVDRYSCEETGYIALQCPRHAHYHVMTPSTLVEIVDEQGAPCPPDKPGRVLLTAIQSYNMPLIRYEVGDMAEWGEQCDCGITLPVIKTLWGRTRQFITTPDGKRTYARIYARDFEGISGLLAYRFVLHQNATVVAQLKTTAPSDEIAARVTEAVQRALGYPYPVRIRFVEKVDWGGSWKEENFAVSDAPPE